MKYLIVLLASICITAASQTPYDSLTNIPDTKISRLIGQSVTVVESSELYPLRKWENNLENVTGSTFTITAMDKDQERPQIWVQLASNSDTIYYRLTGENMQWPPILIDGFYQKQKQLYAGKTLQLKSTYMLTTTTGNEVKFTPEDTFTCTGVEILQSGADLVPSYILQCNGQTLHIPLRGFEDVVSYNIDKFQIK